MTDRNGVPVPCLKGEDMRFIVAFAIAAILALACAKPIRKAPVALYAVALVLDLAYLYGMASDASTGASTGFWAAFLPFMQRCTLAFALFTVVMFTGVLKDGSSLKTRLASIRRQLSITACILALCHIGYYAYTYFFQVLQETGGVPSMNLGMSFCISSVLLVLFVVLLVTSFNAVKRCMRAKTWKRVQRWAYAFYGLIFVHLAFILAPPAIAGKETALVSMGVYTAVFVVYAALRVRRALVNGRPAKEQPR